MSENTWACVNPYPVGTDDIRSRIKSCEKGSVPHPNFPNLYSGKQECIEHCTGSQQARNQAASAADAAWYAEVRERSRRERLAQEEAAARQQREAAMRQQREEVARQQREAAMRQQREADVAQRVREAAARQPREAQMSEGDDEPNTICISPNGEELYIVDTANHNIQVLNVLNGTVLRTYGSKGKGKGQFSYPNGLCISPDGGQLYIVENFNNCIQVLNAYDGTHIRTFDGIQTNESICISPNGEKLYVSTIDYPDYTIKVFQLPNWTLLGNFKGHFSNPYGMCLSPDGGELYVADLDNDRVQVLSTYDGSLIRSINGLSEPTNVRVSPDGRKLYISQTDDTIMVFFLDENRLDVFAECVSPYKLCLSPDGGELFVAGKENKKNRIQVFRA